MSVAYKHRIDVVNINGKKIFAVTTKELLDFYEPIFDWLESNSINYDYIIVDNTKYSPTNCDTFYLRGFYLFFEHKHDLMVFKLRWANVSRG